MKTIFPLLFVLALLVSSSLPASAAPAGQVLSAPDQLLYVDAQVSVFAVKLAEFESGYLAEQGVYFQALPSHAAPPELLEQPDGLLSSPTDQPTPLAALWAFSALPAEIGFSFRVDTYQGEDGPGYVLTVETVIEGVTYQRVENYGPETYRTQPWAELPAPDPAPEE